MNQHRFDRNAGVHNRCKECIVKAQERRTPKSRTQETIERAFDTAMCQDIQILSFSNQYSHKIVLQYIRGDTGVFQLHLLVL